MKRGDIRFGVRFYTFLKMDFRNGNQFRDENEHVSDRKIIEKVGRFVLLYKKKSVRNKASRFGMESKLLHKNCSNVCGSHKCVPDNNER